MIRIPDLGRYMIVSDTGHAPECFDTLCEARERTKELTEQGYNAYVSDLDHELVAL